MSTPGLHIGHVILIDWECRGISDVSHLRDTLECHSHILLHK